jgi:hypothetical protein
MDSRHSMTLGHNAPLATDVSLTMDMRGKWNQDTS